MANQNIGLNILNLNPVEDSITVIQNTVTNNENLTISRIQGLQAALDTKESISDVTTNYYNKGAVDTKFTNLSNTITNNMSNLSNVYQVSGLYVAPSAITALSSIYQISGLYVAPSAITALSSIYQVSGLYVAP